MSQKAESQEVEGQQIGLLDRQLEEHIEVSVVIPCLNEEMTIREAIRAARQAFLDNKINGEVVVADNGSTDDSVKIALEEGAKVVHVEKKGYGHALMNGFEGASGEYCIHLDADMSYDFAHIPRFVEKLREGADLVMGSRFKGTIYPNAMPPLHRYLGTPVLTWIANVFYKTGVSDVNCGMRGLRKEIIDKLQLCCGGMEFASEMIIKVAKLGYTIVEIPTDLRPDKRDRKPHLRTFRDGWRHLRFLLLLSPTWLFLLPGILLTVAGITTLLLVVLNVLPQLGILTGLLSISAVVIGIQIMVLGLAAKTLDHIKRYEKRGGWLESLMKKATMEKGIIAGILAVLIGAGLLVSSFLHIYAFMAGDEYVVGTIDVLATYRSLLGALLLIIGFQVIFSSFLFGVFNIETEDSQRKP